MKLAPQIIGITDTIAFLHEIRLQPTPLKTKEHATVQIILDRDGKELPVDVQIIDKGRCGNDCAGGRLSWAGGDDDECSTCDGTGHAGFEAGAAFTADNNMFRVALSEVEKMTALEAWEDELRRS